MTIPTPEPSVPVTDDPQTPAPAADGESAEAKLARLEKELTETRKEAAKYRTSAKAQEAARAEAEREAAVEQGKFKELYEAETQRRVALETAQAQAALLAVRAQAARDAGLPEHLAARLHGETAEELLTDAKAMAALLKPTAPSTGSTNPAAQRNGAAAAFDPKNPPRLSDIQWKI